MKKRFLIPIIIFSSLVCITGVGALACQIAHPNKYKNFCGFYYSLRTTFFDMCNWFAKKEETVFFGDSLTEYCNLGKYYPNIASHNRGIGGDTSDGLLGRMDASIFNLAPKNIVLLVGINDINNNISTEEISNNVTNIVSQIKTKLPNSKVLLEGVYPHKQENSYLIKNLNGKYAAIASSYGCQFLDFYSLLNLNDALNPNYTNDGLHLNDLGYQVVSKEILKYL